MDEDYYYPQSSDDEDAGDDDDDGYDDFLEDDEDSNTNSYEYTVWFSVYGFFSIVIMINLGFCFSSVKYLNYYKNQVRIKRIKKYSELWLKIVNFVLTYQVFSLLWFCEEVQ